MSFPDEFLQLLAYPSVSTDEAFRPKLKECAAWCARWLSGRGCQVRTVFADSTPIIIADRPGADSLPRLVYYGHYDVQPASPGPEWHGDPFCPTVVGDSVYARGAIDNKGPTYFTLEGLLSPRRRLPPITILLEGEEECGSSALARFLTTDDGQRAVRGDVLVVCDTLSPAAERGGLTVGLRGITTLEVVVHGPAHDLHSGGHGGVAPDPLHEASRLVAALHDQHGSIAVPDFYADLRQPDEEEAALLASIPFDDAEYCRVVGVPPLGGDQRLPVSVRRGWRPTIEVHGMFGGHLGVGQRNIVPARAVIKLGSRLGPGQDPNRCQGALVNFFESTVRPPFKLEIIADDTRSPALTLSLQSQELRRAQAILEAVFGKPPCLIYDGGSIPILSQLAAASKATPLLFGLALDENRMHGPNEHISLHQAHRFQELGERIAAEWGAP